jgi:hypothetical protein
VDLPHNAQVCAAGRCTPQLKRLEVETPGFVQTRIIP